MGKRRIGADSGGPEGKPQAVPVTGEIVIRVSEGRIEMPAAYPQGGSVFTVEQVVEICLKAGQIVSRAALTRPYPGQG